MTTFVSPVHEFVANAHGNLPRVRALLAEHPELRDARFPDWDETALEAAAHMGRPDILRVLIEAGATPGACALAVLGDPEPLRVFLRAHPGEAKRPGAHGFPLLFHAALSGRTDVLDTVWEAGATGGLDFALHGAVNARSAAAASWLLARGARPTVENHEGKTPDRVAAERGLTDLSALLEAAIA